MSALSVEPPYPAFADADGQPLDDGYIFIGTVNDLLCRVLHQQQLACHNRDYATRESALDRRSSLALILLYFR